MKQLKMIVSPAIVEVELLVLCYSLMHYLLGHTVLDFMYPDNKCINWSLDDI